MKKFVLIIILSLLTGSIFAKGLVVKRSISYVGEASDPNFVCAKKITSTRGAAAIKSFLVRGQRDKKDVGMDIDKFLGVVKPPDTACRAFYLHIYRRSNRRSFIIKQINHVKYRFSRLSFHIRSGENIKGGKRYAVVMISAKRDRPLVKSKTYYLIGCVIPHDGNEKENCPIYGRKNRHNLDRGLKNSVKRHWADLKSMLYSDSHMKKPKKNNGRSKKCAYQVTPGDVLHELYAGVKGGSKCAGYRLGSSKEIKCIRTQLARERKRQKKLRKCRK